MNLYFALFTQDAEAAWKEQVRRQIRNMYEHFSRITAWREEFETADGTEISEATSWYMTGS